MIIEQIYPNFFCESRQVINTYNKTNHRIHHNDHKQDNQGI